MLWEQFCVLRLSLVYRGRAIPLVWRVPNHASSSVSFYTYRRLLERVTLLPAGVRWFTGDRGFSNQALMVWVKQQPDGTIIFASRAPAGFAGGAMANSSRSIWRRDKQSCPFRHAIQAPQTRGCPSGDCRDPVSGNFWRSSVLAPQLCKRSGTMACASILRRIG